MAEIKTFSIAIDGPSGAGKSTVAKALAKSLDAMYLDTGAMYRAIGLAMRRMGVDMADAAAVADRVGGVDIAVRYLGGTQHIFLAGEDVSDAIRAPEVSLLASAVSAVPAVRERMVALQREIARGQNVVMDGRDIGTKVLPGATLKVYLTASPEVRAARRCKELEEKGMPQPFETVLEEMKQRDWQDTHRAASPLTKAPDAVVVDSSALTLEETVNALRRLAGQAVDDASKPSCGRAMGALDAMLARHSYRGKFLSDPVPREHLAAIMEAGLSAPSGCNRQTTSLIAVDDPALLARLRAVIDPPRGETAPSMICVLTQPIVAYRGRRFNVQDYAAAIENMLLAAVALGYQSCWYEGHITDEDRIGDQMARILGVPEDYALVCMLPVGIAAEPVQGPRKKAFGERAWFNGFRREDA